MHTNSSEKFAGVSAMLGRAYTYVRDGLAWRVRKLAGDKRVDRAIVRIAHLWRPMVKRPVFIGITGSAGKTTTKELSASILGRTMRGIGSPASLNILPHLAKTILRLRPKHAFCVAELSESQPGEMDGLLALLRPSIGVVTTVQDDHLAAFASRDELSAEMAKLIAALPPTGTAVLNADDERVLAMARNCAAKVITYGTSATADLRAEDICSVWPDRLQMTLVRGEERLRLRTQLCGTHWTASVLAAAGAGLAVGLSLADCAEGIATVAPFAGRMQPVSTSEGVTFIRDDFKAPLWTLDACFEFMRAARATRKIIVIGELSDIGSRKGAQYEKTAIRAQEIADITIFVGPWASSALRARTHGAKDALHAFGHVRDAAEHINSITRTGDLVLLKGSNRQDHLLRIILARSGDVACWRDDCRRHSFCNECPDRTKPSGAPVLLHTPIRAETATPVAAPGLRAIAPDEQVIIGLGNPESTYAGTPHNVGHEVVEHLAASWGLTWEAAPEGWIARGSSQGRRVCLVKINLAMNLTGAGLKRLADSMSLSPRQCILAHDDLDLPIGSVRARVSGGAGGHRGVASILEAFQTDAFRRVKVGVGQAGAKLNRVEYVLTPFDSVHRASIEQALLTAEARVLEMLERARPREQQ